MRIVRRVSKATQVEDNWGKCPEWLKQVFLNRGIGDTMDLRYRMGNVLPRILLTDLSKAGEIVVKAIQDKKFITIAGDYDCDGATGTAVLYRGLKLLGAEHVNYIVPDRFRHGYGLSPALIDDMNPRPDLIITVDSGISSVDGVRHAKERGIEVVITDHHLPGTVLPDADAIVNPNRVGDDFPSKSLAGVGVGLYLLWEVKAQLKSEIDLSELSDLVALGTVADLVPLDANNRNLVAAGVQRIREGKANIGIQEILRVAGVDPANFTSQDFGFAIAPKLNAAGRLENMRLGIECLVSDDPQYVKESVEILNGVNQERKQLQAEMLDQAVELAKRIELKGQTGVGISLYDETWHPGIVGLVASKVKDLTYRPVFAFAPAGEQYHGELRGSGRSIAGIHLRDIMAEMDVAYPGLFIKFGGHAMAAGCSIRVEQIQRFNEAFNEVLSRHVTDELLTEVLYSDGEMTEDMIDPKAAMWIEHWGPWGQGFPPPRFDVVMDVVQWRVIGNGHLKLELEHVASRKRVEAIWFFADPYTPPPIRARWVVEVGMNRWTAPWGKKTEKLQFTICGFNLNTEEVEYEKR